MTEEKRPEERPDEVQPLDEKALEAAAGGVVKPPHTRKPREYERAGG